MKVSGRLQREALISSKTSLKKGVRKLKKKVAVIHTNLLTVMDLKELFKEIVPEVEMINIIDDSLLEDVMRSGGLTESVIKRICIYAIQAEEMGAHIILNQCSSVGEAVDVARNMLTIPYLKIDEPMAREAVKIGRRISVIGTVATTLDPSVRLIERTAAELDKKVDINKVLVDGAIRVLMEEGDREKHNRMVLGAIEEVAKNSDVIVLAQGSMAILLPYLNHIKIPVLTSPRSGVEQLKHVLELEG